MSLVAIHQPNFFPWLGFFDKIARADIFILMDNVQLPRTSKGSWVNRVRLMFNGEPRWATMPVVRDHRTSPHIADVLIDDSQPWRSKLVRSIRLNYSRSSHFEEVFPLVETLVGNPETSLTAYNREAIRSIANLLELRTPIVLGSDVGGEGHATKLLISMVGRVGGEAYLCGAGAAAYQEDEEFHTSGIDLVHQHFQHPVYGQRVKGPFVPGLSVIDVLMNWGVEPTRRFLADQRPKDVPEAGPVTVDKGYGR